MARSTVYNRVVSAELWEEINPKNKELLNDFISYLESTDKSGLTILNYKSDINICFIWSLKYKENKYFIDFKKRDIMEYQKYLINELKVSSNRTRRLRASISSMSNFVEKMLDDEFPNFRNIVNKIEAPTKQEVREKTVLSDEQVEDLLKHLVDNGEYQQACLLALAAGSGARKSELLRFKVDYFKNENIVCGTFYQTSEYIKTKGRGRAGKLLQKYTLVKIFKPYFDLWMNKRKELGIDSEWLFVSKRNEEYNQMKTTVVDTYTNHWTEYLKIEFYIHCLRHYWTSSMARENVPDSVIKILQGWQSLEMVNLYKDIDMKESLEKFFKDGQVINVESKKLEDLK